MNQASKSLEEAYLVAASLDTKPRTFFVGPFASRVSFASQQKRAFNTVWALAQAGKFDAPKRVAVIGAGIAGLTVSAALLAKKCAVHLYEQGPEILHRQNRTIHRFIHPTINFWPDAELESSTAFPFLDWTEANTATVLEALRFEWMSHFHEKVAGTYCNSPVRQVEYKETSESVLLHIDGENPEDHEFDYVVVATGFGPEISMNGASSIEYWDPDQFDSVDISRTDVFVSGCGDGGLIDALRLVHANFDRGQLPVILAENLSDSSIPGQVSEIEKNVKEISLGNSDKAASLYSERYAKLIKDLPVRVKSLLSESLKRKGRVNLVSTGLGPYKTGAAPIHKLMIAHAMAEGMIQYQQGQLAPGPIFTPDGAPPQKLPADALVIVRHGPENPVGGLVTPTEVAVLKSKQGVLADLVLGTPWGDGYWGDFSDYPAQDFSTALFPRFRYGMALSYFGRTFATPIWVDLSDGPPVYKTEDSLLLATVKRRVPRKIFGIDVMRSSKTIADSLAA